MRTFTVQEYIDHLSKFPPDMIMFAFDPDYGYVNPDPPVIIKRPKKYSRDPNTFSWKPIDKKINEAVII